VKGGFPIRQLLVVLVAIPALYISFAVYQIGNVWVALGILIFVCLAAFVFLNESAYTYRYLFPGFLGFGLFVIFPIAYMVFLSFTKYSSQHLLSFDRVVALFREETFPVGAGSYTYKLFAQGKNKYVLYLEDERDTAKRFASDPFELKAGEQLDNQPPKGDRQPGKLKALSPGAAPKGIAMEFSQVTREKLFIPMRGRRFALPDDTLVSLEGLERFTSRERVWNLNGDGSLTNSKDGAVIRPDFKEGYFLNERGEKVGVGFQTFSGLENYLKILTDPRIQGPFYRIFLWTIAFSAMSVVLTFAVGMLLAVILEWKELDFRGGYRTLLILPYAVPAVLSILIFKGLFNQEFGAVNEFLKAMLGFAPEWETNPWGARAMILLVNVWLGYPYMMLICTGMLQSIPSGIYEASAIDGSNSLIDFFRITLPLVFPPLIPILVSSFAFNFNNFNLIYLLTTGGPQMAGGGIAGETDLLVNYTFKIAFRDSGKNYGLASAIATLLFIIVGFLAWINLKLGSKAAKSEIS
jgi:maltose/maltodextrin transport system permease protein